MERPKHHVEIERERIEREEDNVAVNSDESFPASDTPSFPGRDGSRRPQEKEIKHTALNCSARTSC